MVLVPVWYHVMVLVARAAFSVCLRVVSEATLRRFLFPICTQDLPQRHCGGISNFKQKAKVSSKMADGAANQNCSFENPFQPIRVVLLIANMKAAIFEAELCLE